MNFSRSKIDRNDGNKWSKDKERKIEKEYIFNSYKDIDTFIIILFF